MKSILAIFCIIVTTSAFAGSFKECIDGKGHSTFTNSVCPGGFHLKNPPKQPKQIKKIKPAPAVPPEKISISWFDYDITLEDVKMDWYLSSSSSQKESIYHPRIQFVVHNGRDETIERLKIEIFYVEEGDKMFGDDSERIYDLPAGYTSKTIFMKPSIGSIFNGYNKDTITRRTFKVDIFGEYKGIREKITTLDFFSKVTN